MLVYEKLGSVQTQTQSHLTLLKLYSHLHLLRIFDDVSISTTLMMSGPDDAIVEVHRLQR